MPWKQKSIFILNKPAVKVTLVYALFSTLWILFSDWFILTLFKDPLIITRLQTIKGGLFISVSACLIFFLLKSEIRKYRYSEERYRRVIKSLDREYFIYSHKIDGVFTYVSPSIMNILGYTAEEFLKHFTEYMTDSPKNEKVHYYTELSIRGEKQSSYQIEVFHKNGETRFLEVTESPVFDENHIVVAVEGIARDITERKEAEEKLKASEERFNSFMDNAPIMAYIKDQDLNHIYLNSHVQELLDKLGQNMSPSNAETLFNKEISRKLEILDRKILSGESVFEKIEYQTSRLGSQDAWYRDIKFPLKLPDGKRLVGGFSIDITENKKAEKELFESQLKYRTLFDSSADAIFIIEYPDGAIVDCNNKTLEMFRCSAEEIIGKSSAELSSPRQADDGDSAKRIREIIFDLPVQRTIRFEWLHRRFDGEIFDAEVSVTLVEIKSEKFIQANIRDITERKRLDSELRYERDFNKLLINAFPAFLVIINAQGKTKMMNQSMLDTLGYSEEEIVDTDYLTSFIPEKDRTLLRDVFNEIIENKSSTINENRVIAKDGTTYLVEWHGRPIYKSNGEFDFFFGVGIDITERKRLDQEFRLYQYSVEHSADPFFLIQSDGRISYANKAAYNSLGYPPEALTYMRVSDFDLDFPIESWPDFWQRLKTEGSLLFQSHHRTLKGDVFPVEITVNHLEFEGEEHAFAYAKDIRNRLAAEAERKILEDELAQARKMEAIGTLAGGIAHDFNNILSAIFGYADLAKRHIDKKKRLEGYLDEVISGANRARELVKQILTFSRKAQHEKHPVQISLIVKEALKLLRSSIPTTIEIKQNIISNNITNADSTQIHQIIMNLCTNAYYAMRETGGILGVSLTEVEIAETDMIPGIEIKPGEYLKLEISDTGIGMNKETREKIFEPYYTTSEKGEGTGLGLAVVHGIVESHNGFIHVYSEPDQGTKFHVYLPILKQKVDIRKKEKVEEPTRGGSEHIMFVDDEEKILEIAEETLSGYGYQVTIFQNSTQALNNFMENPHHFDMVITDMTMPSMTGAELAQKIMETRRDIPVIICTGHSELINREKAINMGIAEYIEKPLVMKEVLRTIRKVFDSRTIPDPAD